MSVTIVTAEVDSTSSLTDRPGWAGWGRWHGWNPHGRTGGPTVTDQILAEEDEAFFALPGWLGN